MADIPIFSAVRIIPRESDFLNRKTGSRGEVYFDRDSDTLRIYNGRTFGGTEIVSQTNFKKISIEASLSTVSYAVTVSSPQSPDTGNKYRINNDYKPVLNFVVGYTYVFDQTDLTNVFYPNANGTTPNPHPLNFSSDNINGLLGDGTAYTTDVVYFLDNIEVSREIYNSTKFISATSRKIWITVTSSTPSILYYWCSNHLNMGNSISIDEPGSGSGGGGNTTVTVSESVPSTPANGNLWLSTTNGNLYVYINDGDSGQWIQPSGPYPDLSAYALNSSLSSYALNSSLSSYATLTYVDNVINNLPKELFEFSVAADDSSLRQISTGNTIKFIGAGGVTTSSDTDGNITITGGGTTGNVTFTGTTIDTTDSSGIVLTPAVLMESDLTVENELFANSINVTNNINVQGLITSQGSGTPEIVSDNEIYITPGTTTILNGLTTLYQTTEIIETKTGATGTVIHDFLNGAIFFHSGIAANFTANVINVPTTNNRSTGIAIILDQGSTPYIPNAVQIDNVSQSILWSGGSPPSGTANYVDIVNFTFIRANNVWIVLGGLSTYN